MPRRTYLGHAHTSMAAVYSQRPSSSFDHDNVPALCYFKSALVPAVAAHQAIDAILILVAASIVYFVSAGYLNAM